MLTMEELQIVEDLGLIWNRFAGLNVMHSADNDDFVFHIHALQAIIMARSAQRQHPDVFHRFQSAKKDA